MSQGTVFHNPSYYGFSNSTVFDVFNYLHPLLNFLITPLGLFAFVAFAGLIVYGWQGRHGRELLLSLAVLTGMVGYYISPYWNNTLIGPLESFRAMCKPLFVIALLVLALKYLVSGHSMRPAPARHAAVAYLALLAIYALRTGFTAPERALGGGDYGRIAVSGNNTVRSAFGHNRLGQNHKSSSTPDPRGTFL